MSDMQPQTPELDAQTTPTPSANEASRRGRARRVGVIAALVGALAIGGALWRQGVFTRRDATAPDQPHASAETAPARDERAEANALIDRRLAEAPDYASFFSALASRFPADAALIRDNLAALTIAGKAGATPDRFVAVALKTLRETRGVVAAKADTAAMARVFEAQAAMLAALRQTDSKLCVDFVYGGATDAFMAFSGAHRALLAAVAQAALDAIADGGEKKIEREAPGDEDFALLESALREKGFGEPEIAVLLDGKTPDPPLSDDRMCDAARAYVAAVLALPEPARSRVLALAIELMARS